METDGLRFCDAFPYAVSVLLEVIEFVEVDLDLPGVGGIDLEHHPVVREDHRELATADSLLGSGDTYGLANAADVLLDVLDEITLRVSTIDS